MNDKDENKPHAETPPPVTIQAEEEIDEKVRETKTPTNRTHETQMSNMTDGSELNIERGNLLQIPASRKLEKVCLRLHTHIFLLILRIISCLNLI